MKGLRTVLHDPLAPLRVPVRWWLAWRLAQARPKSIWAMMACVEVEMEQESLRLYAMLLMFLGLLLSGLHWVNPQQRLPLLAQTQAMVSTVMALGISGVLMMMVWSLGRCARAAYVCLLNRGALEDLHAWGGGFESTEGTARGADSSAADPTAHSPRALEAAPVTRALKKTYPRALSGRRGLGHCIGIKAGGARVCFGCFWHPDKSCVQRTVPTSTTDAVFRDEQPGHSHLIPTDYGHFC